MTGRTRFPASIGLATVACLLLAATSASAASTVVSSNWAGYVARAGGSVRRFSRVVGVWTEPTATCTAGRASYSAVWVGLGGYSRDAKGLEQIGTDADCSRAGQARYSTWVELLPAASQALRVKVSPGDEVAASVTVKGKVVTLRIEDVTSGEHASIERTTANLDVSSADWIVEAPSACTTATACSTLALADFGTAAFSTATATSAAGTYSPTGGPWSATELLLRQSERVARGASSYVRGGFTLLSATPSEAQAESGSFAVTWAQQETRSEAPGGQSLPGFAGGSPP